MIADWIYGIFGILLAASSTTAAILAASAITTEEHSNENTVLPHMQHYDIWNSFSGDTFETKVINNSDENEIEEMETVNQSFEPFRKRQTNDIQNNNNQTTNNKLENNARKSRVLSIFPVPVDGECLSDDGRRTGNCLNPYVCRSKGGLAKGECALGFGVCCIFVTNCNGTIVNNITYLVSPNFPSFMPNNVSTCIFKLKLVNQDISQLRIDFQHFSLGQPNRRTGICDGDIFKVTGGLSGAFTLCGQNSGQHVYYDVVTRSLPRQALYGNLRPLTLYQLYPNLTFLGNNGFEEMIEITMQFSKRFLPIRLWEIRIAQIPFSQRAPAGCLQFHTGAQGIIQTFNYAENGRHLANQNYRICMRQEVEMCSIMYEPCDEQSFRIGPSNNLRDGLSSTVAGGISTMSTTPTLLANSTMMTVIGTSTIATPNSTTMSTGESTTITATTSSSTAPTTTTPATTTTMQRNSTIRMVSSTPSTDMTTVATTTTTTRAMTTETETTMASIRTTTAATATTTGTATTTAVPIMSEATTASNTATATTTTESQLLLSDDVEGSGGEEDYVYEDGIPPRPSRRPRPIRGGFDLLGFLRSAFDLRLRHRRGRLRVGRQFFSTCNDRITMPCIVEDFIGAGLGPLPGCEPIHCGAQFCSSGVWPCRIESTVTPFYIGIRFGNGIGKGSAEDNIGACLRYTQVQCL